MQNGQVETLRDHLILDAELRRGGLFINGRFFYWTFPNLKCMLEKIRTMKMTKEDGFLIDHDSKILFNAESAIPAPPTAQILRSMPQNTRNSTLQRTRILKYQ